MKISILIPTWRRPPCLHRCLVAISTQTNLPDQLVLVVRNDDQGTRGMLAGLDLGLPIEIVDPGAPGVVAALNAGLDAVRGEIVVITDDDSEPPRDWLAKIDAHFAADPRLGGLGGRDRIAKSDERAAAPEELAVGHIYWFGRVVGNHHLATGDPRDVHIIKGVNMSLRRAALGERRLDTALRGKGVAQNWEIDLCLGIRSDGWRLLYDPAVEVLHHEAQRPAGERENLMSDQERFDAVYNQTLAIVRHLRRAHRLAAVLYALLLGTRDNPGPVLALETIARGTPRQEALARTRVATSARRAALRHWRS